MINNKIKNLTKIFLRDYIDKLNIKNEKNKINKKSSTLWLGIILIFLMTYLSVKMISSLQKGNNPELFFKIYLPIILILIIYQSIILICNLFYYSKDLEYILPLPVKNIEILIAKLFTAIGIMYMTEAVLLLIPMLMYGILVAGTIQYFIYMLFSLAVFPILYISIIGILTLIIMKLLKKIKNKNITQIIIVFTLTAILVIFTIFAFKEDVKEIYNTEDIEIINQNLDKINSKFIITKPIIKLLTEKNILNNLFNILKIIIINLMAFFTFIIIGKKFYFNNLIINKIENKKRNKIKIKYKKLKKEISYLKTDIKKIIKNTTYLTQTIFNYINIIILSLFILKIIVPLFIEQIQTENYIQEVGIEQVKLEATCTVLAVIQIISTFNSLSMTSISKEGRQAIFMKYIPMKLYKQFVLKMIPPVILNIIMSVLVIIVINTCIKIPIIYSIIVLLISILINIIYNLIMLLIDFRKPNLNWTNIESITKNNNNKIYRYVITIIIVLILMYFGKIFKYFKFNISAIIMGIILTLIILLFNYFIKKNIDKIFNKIY